MGVSTKDLTFAGHRTLADEREVERYVPPAGTKYLYLVGRRAPQDEGNGPVVSRLMKAVYWLTGLPTSAHYHEQGIVTTPEKAAVAAKSYEGGYAIRLPVDSLLPPGCVDWRFQFKGKGLSLNRDGGEPELFEVVSREQREAELAELREWREGRRETQEVALLRQRAECLTRLARFETRVDRALEDLDRRLRALEGRHATVVRQPHRHVAAAH